ncbi:hypothetical protein [Kineococcus sp. SYSU DK005]|uniref:hypothetical protein n=1 Tax=Kineococcus sp. SYSU DK005 TaxID=3383126 RepID=UPI003D7D7A16
MAGSRDHPGHDQSDHDQSDHDQSDHDPVNRFMIVLLKRSGSCSRAAIEVTGAVWTPALISTARRLDVQLKDWQTGV